jgi:hypothetical protein
MWLGSTISSAVIENNMRTESMTIVSNPDAEDAESLPYLNPETSPALSTTPRRIAYACGDCETPLAELAEGLRPQFAIVCPDCESFNAFPKNEAD